MNTSYLFLHSTAYYTIHLEIHISFNKAKLDKDYIQLVGPDIKMSFDLL